MSAEKKLPISVCMIAGNEAQRISRALASVADWVQEIVVVTDPAVHDGTAAMAEQFGAKVFCEPWRGHAVHRNIASQKATQPWLLALDADEVVTPKLRDSIRAAFQRPAAMAAAYEFSRCTCFCGRWIRHGDWYPDRKVRLWQRGKAQWNGAYLHEKLVVDGSVRRLAGELQHHSMDGLDHFARKSIKISELFLLQKRERAEIRPSLCAMVFHSWWRFTRGYFLRLGFLDGWQGYAIARMIEFETFLRYAKIQEATASSAASEPGRIEIKVIAQPEKGAVDPAAIPHGKP
jgi:glycosyltransferase involved in cell wall biosynthesis